MRTIAYILRGLQENLAILQQCAKYVAFMDGA